MTRGWLIPLAAVASLFAVVLLSSLATGDGQAITHGQRASGVALAGLATGAAILIAMWLYAKWRP